MRDRILDLAVALFSSHGYERTSIREIAESAGVSKAALYYYFTKKDELLLAALEPLGKIQREAEAIARVGRASPENQMTALVYLISGLDAHRAIARLALRNRAACDEVVRRTQPTVEPNEPLHFVFNDLILDETVPVERRTRLACAREVVLYGPLLDPTFASIPFAVLGPMLLEVLEDIVLHPRCRVSPGLECRR